MNWMLTIVAVSLAVFIMTPGSGAQSGCKRISSGGFLRQSLRINTFDSPCIIRDNLIIGARATLTVDPGVTLQFSPGVMLAVNGTLIARGEPNNRITFTKAKSADSAAPVWPSDIRLVDDFSVHVGRLQMRYKHKWRGICANHKNWTMADVNVACQQLGFRSGNFSFLPWARNDSSYIRYQEPNCVGNESHILDCPGSRNIRIGSKICLFQRTIHLHCFGLSNTTAARDHWWGIELYNATYIQSVDGVSEINESATILQNVDIMFAGVSPTMDPVPALRASPTVPALINVTILHSALDAMNYSEVMSSTIVYNTFISNSRGHGLVVETLLGRVEVKNSIFTHNFGNGIKAKFLDGRFAVVDDLLTFCRMASLDNPKFPQIIVGIPGPFSECTRLFRTINGHRLTLNVLEMDIEPDANGTLEVYDSCDLRPQKLIASFAVINNTLPMGVSSTFYCMFVRFTWVRPKKDCATQKDCVKFTILVDTSPEPETKPEFYMNNTIASNNTQHGVYLENIRNYVIVNASAVSYNGYGAGLCVYGGAGDILVNASTVNFNQDNGVNITYDGGWRMFNHSSFSYNFGSGVNMTFNETSIDNRTRYTRHQRTEVSWSTFLYNEGHGVHVGNYCRAASAFVNDSTFIGNWLAAVMMDSCYLPVLPANSTNFTVSYNIFHHNREHAVKIAPLISAVGTVANNTFTNHSKYVLLLDNTDDFLRSIYYRTMTVNYSVISNQFLHNRGYYVANFRLTQGSPKQKMDVMYNVFADNEITGAFPTLNQRTRSYAVVILSSSNVNLNRNHLVNPASQYEIATHLLELVVLQATAQWWGTVDYNYIIHRIFDQYSRYNLAKIQYHPALEFPWLYTSVVTDRSIELEVEFIRGGYLGGRLARRLETTPGKTYIVDRDAAVMGLGGELYVKPGTVLEFSNALGMLVEGYVHFEGTEQNPITLLLRNESTWVNNTRVRLVDGPSLLEGRLEVRPTEEDEWGTVCRDGWTMQDSAVACQMMGLVVHPSSWQVYDNVPSADVAQPIWRSNVECTSLDSDVMECVADDQFDHSCNHSKDVYVRCVTPTWAGIHFLGNAIPSVMTYTTVSGAGLMDPSLTFYTSAIAIDYNVHRLDHITVQDNLADGVLVMHNDVFAGARISNSEIRRNLGNGVSTRGSFFQLFNCTLADNTAAGFEYNPSYTTYEALQIRSGVNSPYLFERNGSITLDIENRAWVVTPQKAYAETTLYELVVSTTSSLYKVAVDIIDYNPLTDIEQVTVYDARPSAIQRSTVHWTIDEDLVDFPVVSQLSVMTIRWKVDGISSGRLTFVLRSMAWNWVWPFPTVAVLNSTVVGNARGIVTRHYNHPSNEYLDLFFRFHWETVRLYGVTLDSNKYEALYVPSFSKYNVLYLPTYEELQAALRLSEITYEVEACLFVNNGLGVVGEHPTVEFSNNLWIWRVDGNRFERNLGGGFEIALPRVNLMFTDLYNHSVNVNSTIFEDNVNFAFHIDGFYCNASIASNRFQGNKCRTGCVTLSGTEKEAEIVDNEFVENSGRYIVEMYMNSHTPYTQWVEATISFNNFKRNSRPSGRNRSEVVASSSPTSYALGIRGLQNVTVTRNLFSNPLMDFELLGGQDSSLLENYLDATENYWGTTEQSEIVSRIFDFDDWNSFAIVEYFPFLVSDRYNSRKFIGTKWRPIFDMSGPIGGRITENLRLKPRSQPYIVNRDLTVMNGVSLTIEAGTELQFYPNIGILVLGSLVALGTSNNPVRLNPVLKSQYVSPNRESRATESAARIHHPDLSPHLGYQLRLSGGSSSDDGYIEIYNETDHRWTIVCDDNFNDFTAQVACRTMGKEASNVVVRRNPYYDIFVFGYPLMHEQHVEWFWRQTLLCDGSESSLEQCRYRLNYNLEQCLIERQYVFVRCGKRNLPEEYNYWGNVRFATPNVESAAVMPGYSSLDYVDIYGAGILHGDRVAAVQGVYRTPTSSHVRIHNSDWHGYDYVAPAGVFNILYGDISNNNGYAARVTVLNGASSDLVESQFVPLVLNSVPHNVHGLIRMCTTEKFMYVVDRALLYYKYDYQGTVDCIKLIRSKEAYKRIAIRFLQVNIFNDTVYRNAIELYNGEYFDHRQLIAMLTVNSTLAQIRRQYKTSQYDTMGIRVTASPAFEDFGFIAEVVTIPLSPGWRPDYGAGQLQRVAHNAMTRNEAGGFIFQNVGETNPRVAFESNNIQHCGVGVLNNTAVGVVDFYVQNTKLLTIANNFLAHNAGGININTTTKDNEVAIYANITNNVIVYTTHGDALHIEGHQYQGFDVRYNYLAFNNVSYRNIFAAFGVQLNFTSNIVYNNTGQCILNASVLEMISINQRYTHNAIYQNWAFADNQSTMFLKSAKFEIMYNFFLNPYNLYEITTFNRTKYPYGIYPSVHAPYNWWGHGDVAYVAGRIWERRDDDNLIRVEYQPPLRDNSSVLEGKCYPGWRQFDNKCYWYFGGAVTYATAYSFCKHNGAILAWARDPKGYERQLGELVAQFQYNYDIKWQSWVYSDWQEDDTCTALREYKVRHIPCNTLLPFACERDPYIDVGVVWLPIIIIIVITACVLCFVVLPLLVFAAFKSSQRHEEKVIRRDTLRQSLRSRSRSRSMTATAAAAAMSSSRGSEEVKRRRPPMSTMVLDISGVTLDESTVDGKHKTMDTTTWSTSTADVPKKRPIDESSYDDSDLGPVHRSFPAASYPAPKRPLENEIATVGGRSLYGPAPAYRSAGGFFNEGYLGDTYPGQSANSFDDRSIDARFANVVQSALDGSNGVAGSSHGRTSRPRPQLSTTGGSGAPYSGRHRTGDSPRPTDSSGTPTGASSAASRTKRPRPKINV